MKSLSLISASHKEVVRISLPLVLSMGATTLMEFTDRIFLARYSLDAIAAAVPSGFMVLLVMTFFLGTAGYISVFIAHYIGSHRFDSVGKMLWQGIYFSLAATVIFIGFSMLGPLIFDLMGHAPAIRSLESEYFRILCVFAGCDILGAVFSGFYIGQGRTRPVLLVTMLGMFVNIPLDYCLINGIWLFPEWGIRGAAVATGISWAIIMLLLGVLVFLPQQVRHFSLLSTKQLDAARLLRLVRVGFPNGFQFFLDIFAFTVFAAVVGHIGVQELAATNIVLNINAIAFMPLVGFSMGTSTLVGQAMGAGCPQKAQLMTRSSLHLAGMYTVLVAMVYLVFPGPLLGVFKPANLSFEAYAPVLGMSAELLYFVLGYLAFDVLTFVLAGTLKGAGDIAFIVYAHGAAAIVCMIVPLGVGVFWLGRGVYFAWTCVLCYSLFLSTAMTMRYRGGKWKKIRMAGDDNEIV
ncbi:MAG: MATE family efflux transporter [Desulfoplanes sp.]|nr:MATE family efflux transporter [Desulfoplanes sp.]